MVVPQKMDGENHGKPTLKTDYLGGKLPPLKETPTYSLLVTGFLVSQLGKKIPQAIKSANVPIQDHLHWLQQHHRVSGFQPGRMEVLKLWVFFCRLF